MTNKQTFQVLAVLLSFAFLLGATAVVAIIKVKSDGVHSLAEKTLFECETATVQDTENDPTATDGFGPDATALLLAAGWRGDPTDGSDRTLYSPACVVPTLSGSMWDDVEAEGEIEYWGEYDGHDGCEALLGETTVIRCPDGYKTTS